MGDKYRLELVKLAGPVVEGDDEVLLVVEGSAVAIMRNVDGIGIELGPVELLPEISAPVSAVGNYGAGQPAERPIEFTPAEPVKRKRRTKAEMAAARAAGEAEVAGEVASDDAPEPVATQPAEPIAMTPGQQMPLSQPVAYTGNVNPVTGSPEIAPPAPPAEQQSQAAAVYNPFA